MPVFTNFAATLARQPSAASLAPRLNYCHFLRKFREINVFSSYFASETKFLSVSTLESLQQLISRKWLKMDNFTFTKKSRIHPTLKNNMYCNNNDSYQLQPLSIRLIQIGYPIEKGSWSLLTTFLVLLSI